MLNSGLTERKSEGRDARSGCVVYAAAADAATVACRIGTEQRHAATRARSGTSRPCSHTWSAALAISSHARRASRSGRGCNLVPAGGGAVRRRAPCTGRHRRSLHVAGRLRVSIREAVAGTAMDQLVHTWISPSRSAPTASSTRTGRGVRDDVPTADAGHRAQRGSGRPEVVVLQRLAEVRAALDELWAIVSAP